MAKPLSAYSLADFDQIGDFTDAGPAPSCPIVDHDKFVVGKYGLIECIAVSVVKENSNVSFCSAASAVAAGVGVASACGAATEQAVSKNAAANILVRISAVFFIWTCPFHILR
jgi:hypothetical protein